jgi:hypothetical protein
LVTHPKLALCNFIEDPGQLKSFALEHGFDGIDWTFSQHNLPRDAKETTALVETISGLSPLEVRYHCFLKNTDLGHVDESEADNAMHMLRSTCSAVSAVGGSVVTIHIGLGRESTEDLSWDKTVEGLAALVEFADSLGIRVCLENLAWGWTSRPRLFEKLLRKSGCWGTLDIGHARVSPSVASQGYQIADFVSPHPQRFLNAHIYHEETEDGHTPARAVEEVADRLLLLERLFMCDWWVLELREEKALLETLDTVRAFLAGRSDDQADRPMWAYRATQAESGQIGRNFGSSLSRY